MRNEPSLWYNFRGWRNEWRIIGKEDQSTCFSLVLYVAENCFRALAQGEEQGT